MAHNCGGDAQWLPNAGTRSGCGAPKGSETGADLAPHLHSGPGAGGEVGGQGRGRSNPTRPRPIPFPSLREIEKHYKEVKIKVKAGQLEDLDDFFLQSQRPETSMAGGVEEGYETPYADSDEDDSVDEMGSDGEVGTTKSKHPSMHACPPKRDNRMVTSVRIAEKYGNFISANPSWPLAHMKATVQEEMFAEASYAKLKRAKWLFMKKMDATVGQYQKLYNYQLELLRSNPGSTVVVNKEIGLDPPVFKRI
uniref:Uncharacterized protein n=1 Tax=Oryza glaberrima TaxID=4538 RepID=I1R4J3_ORYGL